eukprot:767004-Hanusia_phi.AAC.9
MLARTHRRSPAADHARSSRALGDWRLEYKRMSCPNPMQMLLLTLLEDEGEDLRRVTGERRREVKGVRMRMRGLRMRMRRSENCEQEQRVPGTCNNVVEVLVDLLLLPVLGQEAAENTLAAHPDDLGGETSLGGTLALTETHVSSLPLRLVLSVHARARVDGDRLADDVTVLHQLADVLARVGHGDLVDLIRVEPDLALAALEHGGSKALLQPEGNHDAKTN